LTRKYGRLAVLLAAVVAASVACSSGGGKPAPAAGAARTVGRAHATSSPSPASATAVTKADKWLTGPAEKLLGSVNVDVVGVSKAMTTDQHRTAVTTAGQRLATAAHAALDGPAPPVDTSLYRSALTALMAAGRDAAGGRLGAVEPLLAAGTSEITKVTAAADLVAPDGQPAGVGDPS
jgi:hypothetical protein